MIIVDDDNVAVAVSIAAAAYAVVKATSRKRTAAPWTRVKIELFASSCCLPSFFFSRRAQFHAQEDVYLHICKASFVSAARLQSFGRRALDVGVPSYHRRLAKSGPAAADKEVTA
jgi:hypothetical protein